MDKGLINRLLIGRFERYFMHSDSTRLVLEPGDNVPACGNVRLALVELGFARAQTSDANLFDEKLADAVRRFQTEHKLRNSDGLVGPGTRTRLVEELLEKYPASFKRLDRSGVKPTVFLSYAWDDSAKVDKLSQWLRDNGVEVIIDRESFPAGSKIPDRIQTSVFAADKTIAVYSRQSAARDWPSFERQIAEQLESQIPTPALIYLRLDDTPLKTYDKDRIYIDARVKTLKQIGQEILSALNVPSAPRRYEYNEEELL